MDLFERRQVGALASVISSDLKDAQYLVGSGRLQVSKPSLEVAKRIISNGRVAGDAFVLRQEDIRNAVVQVRNTNNFDEESIQEVEDIFIEEAAL